MAIYLTILRIPTIVEIQTIVEAAHIRDKALTLVLISSGIRDCAIEQLKVSDYTHIEGIGCLIGGLDSDIRSPVCI